MDVCAYPQGEVGVRTVLTLEAKLLGLPPNRLAEVEEAYGLSFLREHGSESVCGALLHISHDGSPHPVRSWPALLDCGLDYLQQFTIGWFLLIGK